MNGCILLYMTAQCKNNACLRNVSTFHSLHSGAQWARCHAPNMCEPHLLFIIVVIIAFNIHIHMWLVPFTFCNAPYCIVTQCSVANACQPCKHSHTFLAQAGCVCCSALPFSHDMKTLALCSFAPLAHQRVSEAIAIHVTMNSCNC
jgi:hypothetical protein